MIDLLTKEKFKKINRQITVNVKESQKLSSTFRGKTLTKTNAIGLNSVSNQNINLSSKLNLVNTTDLRINNCESIEKLRKQSVNIYNLNFDFIFILRTKILLRALMKIKVRFKIKKSEVIKSISKFYFFIIVLLYRIDQILKLDTSRLLGNHYKLLSSSLIPALNLSSSAHWTQRTTNSTVCIDLPALPK